MAQNFVLKLCGDVERRLMTVHDRTRLIGGTDQKGTLMECLFEMMFALQANDVAYGNDDANANDVCLTAH